MFNTEQLTNSTLSEAIRDVSVTLIATTDHTKYDILQERVIELLSADFTPSISLQLQILLPLMEKKLDLYPILKHGSNPETRKYFLSLVEESYLYEEFCSNCILEGDEALLREVLGDVVWEQFGIDRNSILVAVLNFGSLETAKFIWSLWFEEVDLFNSMLSAACCNSLEMAQWVYSLGELDHHWKEEEAFCNACQTSLELAQWVWSLGGVDHHVSNNMAFFSALSHSLQMAKWVYSLGGIDHRMEDNMAWNVCRSSPQELVDQLIWLCKLGMDEEVVSKTFIYITY